MLLAPVLPMYPYAPAGRSTRTTSATASGSTSRGASSTGARSTGWPRPTPGARSSAACSEATAYQLDATPDLRTPDELHVVLLLGDPTDAFFVNVTGGYFGIGGFSGCLTVTVWPTDANEHKVGYCAVHELHHNLRFSNVEWNLATVTVGDQVVSEGLAEVFVRELYGPAAMGPWGDPARDDEDAYRKLVDNLGVAGMGNLAA